MPSDFTSEPDAHAQPERRGSRLLVVLPSWIGDAVMATPSVRLLRECLPGWFIGGLMRPGIDQLLAGIELFDEEHVGRAVGVMGPKRVAQKLRPRRYDIALLMTNSFSTALITRIAGIPRRIGYDRDGRGILLTERLQPLKRKDVTPYNRSSTNPGAWAPVPACEYYDRLSRHLLSELGQHPPAMGPLELALTASDELDAHACLARVCPDALDQSSTRPNVLLIPGGNNPAKRWPADRFAALADWLARNRGARVLISGAPNEAELVADVASRCASDTPAFDLTSTRMSLGALKGVIARCKLVVTNDTGPRHIAAALGVPVVTLFGPTDHRWTTIPFDEEIRLLADPKLPEEEVANDHPERCAIDNIGLGDACAACAKLLTEAPV
ncbi:MAG: glycosyltransferase family 9 protein [Planctomycetota bacterium]